MQKQSMTNTAMTSMCYSDLLYKGIPLGVVTAIAYSELYGKEVRYCSDRKEEKDHGADKGSFLGSKLKDGDRVVMIEDVTNIRKIYGRDSSEVKVLPM